MMGVVSSAHTSSVGAERRARGEMWVDDLCWHQQMFKRARFRWTGEHVMAIVTRYTSGQLDFTTVRDLELLHRYQLELLDYSCQARDALAERLPAVNETLGGCWEPTAQALGLTVIDCKAAVWFAAGTTPNQRTNLNVRRVLEYVPFRNPLIEAWELKQLWRMYEAAADVFEDTICDLVEELRDSRPIDVLVQATDTLSSAGLQQRIRTAREERGRSEDPRRMPTQAF